MCRKYTAGSNGLCLSTLPQKMLNTHMRGWLLLLLKNSELKSAMRPRFLGCIETPIVRQSVNDKKYFHWFTNGWRITNHKTHHNQSKHMLQCYMHKCIPLYFIGVAIPANIMPKRDFHEYETRIYTLRFHFQSLFDTFNTFNTFNWYIMSAYKSTAMVEITILST